MLDSLNIPLSKPSFLYEYDPIVDSKEAVQHLSACLSCPQQPTAIQTQIWTDTVTQHHHKRLNTRMFNMQTIQIFKLVTTKTAYQSEVALLPVPTKNVKDIH